MATRRRSDLAALAALLLGAALVALATTRDAGEASGSSDDASVATTDPAPLDAPHCGRRGEAPDDPFAAFAAFPRAGASRAPSSPLHTVALDWRP